MDAENDKSIRRTLAALAESDHTANVAEQPASVHPFPARMPAPLAEHLIRSLLPDGGTLLDPMAGSGSTLIAARRLGYVGHGVDMDPLAVVLSRTATTSYKRVALEELGDRILTNARRFHGGLSKRSIATVLNCGEEEKAFLRYWFSQRCQRQLYCLRKAILAERSPTLQNVAWAAFSSLIIAKEASVSFAIDISRSRPHKVEDRELDDPFEVWSRRFGKVIARLPFVDEETTVGAPSINRGDARKLRLKDRSIDMVLTSPPYLNAIDYVRGHKFSLLWMGHELDALRSTRGRMIGSERGMWKPDGLPPSVENRLAEDCQDEQVQAVTRRYLSDLRYSILEMRRVVRPGGLITIVLGPSIVNRQEADSLQLAKSLARSAGLQYVAGVLRPLKQSRRSLPPPQVMPKMSELASRMSSEAIAVLRKKRR